MRRPRGSKNSKDSDCLAIRSGHKMGMSVRDLSKQFETSISTISTTLNRQNRSKPTGIPFKTSPAVDRIMTLMSKKNPRLTSTDINRRLKQGFDIDVIFLHIVTEFWVFIVSRFLMTLSNVVSGGPDFSADVRPRNL